MLRPRNHLHNTHSFRGSKNGYTAATKSYKLRLLQLTKGWGGRGLVFETYRHLPSPSPSQLISPSRSTSSLSSPSASYSFENQVLLAGHMLRCQAFDNFLATKFQSVKRSNEHLRLWIHPNSKRLLSSSSLSGMVERVLNL